MNDPVISVSAGTRRFGGTIALDAVSLSLLRGAAYGLVGVRSRVGYLSEEDDLPGWMRVTRARTIRFRGKSR